MGALPPGPQYLLRVAPHFAIPSVATYVALNWLQKQLNPTWLIPTWFIISVTALARPLIFFVRRYYNAWADERTAAAHGAILAPNVQLGPWSIITEILEGINKGYPAEVMLKWHNEYGTVAQFNLLTSTTSIDVLLKLMTLEPEHVKALLATQFDFFEKGPIFHSMMNSLLGAGVFNADGELWKFHRAITRPFFTRERISDFEIYARNSDLCLHEARKRLKEGYPVDFQDLVSRFTLDSATEFLFGGTVGSLAAGLPYPPKDTYKNSSSFYNHPSTKFVKAFTQGLYQSADKIVPLRKVMDDFTEPLMKKALAKLEKDLVDNINPNEQEAETLLAHLVNQTQDPKILKYEANVERRLRYEVLEMVGSVGTPNYEHMREMKYTRAFLNEVLRLYPPVPINARTNTKPIILPAAGPDQKPVYVPANTGCLYTVLNIHRRTDLWGPDALKFDPDRFLDERLQKYLTSNTYIFCPFNAGPRICLGQQFAYHEATFFLVRLLQQFREFTLDMVVNTPPPASWATGDGLKPREKIHPMSHLMMYVKGGLWVQMTETKHDGI